MDLSAVLTDVAAYESNLRLLKEYTQAKAPGAEVMAVLKADAYGHGIRQLAPAAVAAGAAAIGVVDNWEAACVRELRLGDVAVVRLRPTVPAEAAEAAAWGVQEVVGSLAAAEMLAALGRERGEPVRVHVMLDSGMNRMGVHAATAAGAQELAQICALEGDGIRIQSAMTHFPCADEPDEADTADALSAFLDAAAAHIAPAVEGPLRLQVANSATTLRFIGTDLVDRWPALRDARGWVREGICSYGLRPSEHVPWPEGLRPVMRWTTTVVLVREVPAGSSVGYGRTFTAPRAMRIATLPLGYADGYPRILSGAGADVLVRGRRCAVLGRVSMNLLTVDVTDVAGAEAGDTAVLLGSDGSECITADELAAKAQTINYEITCSAGWQRRAV